MVALSGGFSESRHISAIHCSTMSSLARGIPSTSRVLSLTPRTIVPPLLFAIPATTSAIAACRGPMTFDP